MNQEIIIYSLPIILFAVACATILILKLRYLAAQTDFEALRQEKQIQFDFDATQAIIASASAATILFVLILFFYTPTIGMRHDSCEKELTECKRENTMVREQIKDVFNIK